MNPDLREVLVASIRGSKMIGKALADGKISLSDGLEALPELPGLFSDVMAAVKDIKNVKIADVDTEEERAEVLAFVKEQFDIPNKETEALVEEFADTILSFIGSAVKVAHLATRLAVGTGG